MCSATLKPSTRVLAPPLTPSYTIMWNQTIPIQIKIKVIYNKPKSKWLLVWLSWDAFDLPPIYIPMYLDIIFEQVVL